MSVSIDLNAKKGESCEEVLFYIRQFKNRFVAIEEDHKFDISRYVKSLLKFMSTYEDKLEKIINDKSFDENFDEFREKELATLEDEMLAIHDNFFYAMQFFMKLQQEFAKVQSKMLTVKEI